MGVARLLKPAVLAAGALVALAAAAWAQEAPKPRASDACLACHADEVKSKGTRVDGDVFERSAHGGREGCARCHSGYDTYPHPSGKETVGCAECHEEQGEKLTASVHGKAPAPGSSIAKAPQCADCHGVHDVFKAKQRESRLYPLNVPRTCGTCHFGHEGVATEPVEALMKERYTDDTHGSGLLLSGLVIAPTCVTCHGGHDVQPHEDPKSPVNRARVAETCGRCHVGILEQYRESVHGRTPRGRPQDNSNGMEPATCIDCHQPHRIREPDGAFKLSVVDACVKCHDERGATYRGTFHGKMTSLGSANVAMCADCHTAHRMLPASDPKSSVHPSNLVATCAKCHPGSHEGFTTYIAHADHHDSERYPALYWAFWGMTGLLVGTMAVALLHTAAWSWRLWRTRTDWRAHRAAVRAAESVPGVKLYRRFNRYQRMQHMLLILSFFTLALTGMTLKFSDAGWAAAASRILGGTSSMHLLHRLAAVTLLTVFTVHVLSLCRHRRESGKTWRQLVFGPDSLMFNGGDLRDLRATVRWFAGRGPRPAYGRFTYWEKFDYFAVFWGVAVIGLTGLVLWFPEAATRVLPGPAINLATIIHSDEALLAVVFIFTIHFFNANLRPDKFPIDPVMFTGRMTLEELKRDKPREFERLAAAGQLEKDLVEPFPKRVEHGFRVFGMIALTVGLTLVGLIVYALLTY